MASWLVPALETAASSPAGSVVTPPTATVAASPLSPLSESRCASVRLSKATVPSAPRGMVKRRTALCSSPVFSTLACVPGSPVAVAPTETLADAPWSPLGSTMSSTAFCGVPLFVTEGSSPFVTEPISMLPAGPVAPTISGIGSLHSALGSAVFRSLCHR